MQATPHKPAPRTSQPDPSIPLANSRHEKVVQAVAVGMGLGAAYRSVYGGSLPNALMAGSRLMSLAKCRFRLEWLKAEAARDTAWDLERLIRVAEQARRHAHEAGQLTAAVLAVKEIGILTGLRVEQREVRTARLEDMSTAELRAIAAQGRAMLPPSQSKTEGKTGLEPGGDSLAISGPCNDSVGDAPSVELGAADPSPTGPTPPGMDRPPAPSDRAGSPLSPTDCAGERGLG